MISIEINDQGVQTLLNTLASRLGDMTPVMRRIGEALAEGSKQRFEAAGDWDGTSWVPNAGATIMRYLGVTKGNFKKDGSLSKKGTKRAGAKKPLTGETRSLRSTIFYHASSTGVSIGSPMEYAATQQFGAKKGAFGHTRLGAPIPWGDIPPRPFLGLSGDDRATILDKINGYLRG